MTGFFSLQSEFQWERAFSDMTSQPSNPRNLAAERAYFGFRGPLQFSINYLLDLPVGKGKFISTRWAGKLGFLMEGWRISGITTLQTGGPFHPVMLGDFNRVTADGNLLEFRVQLFNAFNHPNFQQPGNWLGTETFGVISNADDGREIEVALKYTF
jgi:hypothetical protein